MDIKAIITNNLPDGVELSDTQVSSIAKAISTEQGREFVPKEDYSKKISRVDELETELANARSASAETDHYKRKYEDEKEAHRQTKATFESEKAVSTKRQALHRHLQNEGANPKLIDLLESKFDLSALELDGDNIKDWEAHAKPVKEQYAEVFGTVRTQGVQVAMPPVQNKQGNSMPSPADEIKKLNSHRIAL